MEKKQHIIFERIFPRQLFWGAISKNIQLHTVSAKFNEVPEITLK